MILPEYDSQRARWDEHRRFHNKPLSWVSFFETRELVLYYNKLRPDQRQSSGTNVLVGSSLCITATGDSDCPRFTLDPDSITPEVVAAFAEANVDPDKYIKEPMPMAWLNEGGQQELLIDTETGRTVGFRRCGGDSDTKRSSDWNTVPQWVTSHYNRSVYVAGPGAKAIGHKVFVSAPRAVPKAEREVMAHLHQAAEAWVRLCNHDYRTHAPQYYAYDSRTGEYPYRGPVDPKKLPKGMDTELHDMKPEQIFQLSNHGFAPTRVGVWVESITAKV